MTWGTRFGRALTAYCREHDTTVRGIADGLGVRPAGLYQIARGERPMMPSMMDNLPPVLARAAALDAAQGYARKRQAMLAIARALAPAAGAQVNPK